MYYLAFKIKHFLDPIFDMAEDMLCIAYIAAYLGVFRVMQKRL